MENNRSFLNTLDVIVKVFISLIGFAVILGLSLMAGAFANLVATPSYLDFQHNWPQRHHVLTGWLVGIVVFLSIIALVYQDYRARNSKDLEDEDDCPETCPCPFHPWNEQDDSAPTSPATSPPFGRPSHWDAPNQ